MFGGDMQETEGREGQTPDGTRAERAIAGRRNRRSAGRGGSFARAEGQCRTLRWACRCSASRAAPRGPCRFTLERAALPSPFCRSPARHSRPITPPPDAAGWIGWPKCAGQSRQKKARGSPRGRDPSGPRNALRRPGPVLRPDRRLAHASRSTRRRCVRGEAPRRRFRGDTKRNPARSSAFLVWRCRDSEGRCETVRSACLRGGTKRRASCSREAKKTRRVAGRGARRRTSRRVSQRAVYGDARARSLVMRARRHPGRSDGGPTPVPDENASSPTRRVGARGATGVAFLIFFRPKKNESVPRARVRGAPFPQKEHAGSTSARFTGVSIVRMVESRLEGSSHVTPASVRFASSTERATRSGGGARASTRSRGRAHHPAVVRHAPSSDPFRGEDGEKTRAVASRREGVGSRVACDGADADVVA